MDDREEIRIRYRELLKPARISGTYVCPICQNGTGETGDGIRENPRARKPGSLKCFKCGFSGDIIDLYRETHNCTVREAFSELRETLGIEKPAAERERITPKSEREGASEKAADIKQSAEEPPQYDFTGYYRECMARLSDPAAVEYLAGRGISIDTAKRYFVGYDPQADPANDPGGQGKNLYPTRRIILPTTKGHYVGRAIDQAAKIPKANPKGAHPGIFNESALARAQVVFVTEGIFDALSIIEAGGEAIATNSAANAKMLIKRMEETRPAARLVLCRDNDNSGERWAATIRAGLTRLHIPFLSADITGGEKDGNAALQKDRAAFVEAVRAAIMEAQKMEATQKGGEIIANRSQENAENQNGVIDGVKEENAKSGNFVNVADYITGGAFNSDLAYFAKYKDRKTGFSDIDRYLTLYPGLAVLGGASSLGKTTFCVNLAENLIDRGEAVLYFTLEQSAVEITTKGLARAAYMKADGRTTITNTMIKNGITGGEIETLKREYAARTKDFYIIRGDFEVTAAAIRDQVERWIKANAGRRPIVIIDYLQLIAPAAGVRDDMRSIIDGNLKALKRMQRDLELFVLVVSSFNRSAYKEPACYESFKESGMIEFTCDYVWALQYYVQRADNSLYYQKKGKQGAMVQTSDQEKEEAIEREQQKNPREIQFVSLKSRNGQQLYDARFYYYPAHDVYTEWAKADEGEWFEDLSDVR